MSKNYFNIAGFQFVIKFPDEFKIEQYLPSFSPFATEDADNPLFSVEILHGTKAPEFSDATVVDVNDSGLGHNTLLRTPNAYVGQAQFCDCPTTHTMVCDHLFSEATIYATLTAPYVQVCLQSLMQIIYAMSIIPHHAMMFHSSTVALNGKAYMFLGKSGTGKSTHARMWLSAVPGTTLLNDDHPIVKRSPDGTYRVHGSAWSGKTPCYINTNYPIGGIARIVRAKQNVASPSATPFQSFLLLLPSCALIQSDKRLHDTLNNTLIDICEHTDVATMHCLPNEEAAIVCSKHFSKQL